MKATRWARNYSVPPPDEYTKGPVLFPPSPPDPPADNVVTLKPDAESVNTFQNHYFARLTQYKPVTLATLSPETLAPRIDSVDYVYDEAPYTDIEKKSIGNNFGSNYNQFETRTALPSIYNALAQQTTQRSYPVYDYQSNIQVNQNKNTDISEEGNNSENEKDKSYAFSYTVKDQKTGDDFSHSQQSSGSATNGEYRVKLPDGRTQIVSYTADENGYKADVRYDVDTPNIEYNYNNIKANNRKDYNDYNAPNVAKINDNQTPTKLDYTDLSKEYYNDYSAEYNSKNYEPHQSKFAILFNSKNNELKDFNQYLTTVKPYVKLEDVLSKALPNVQPTFNYYAKDPAENVVLIGNRNTFKNPSDTNFINSTPRNYLVSTISSLRDRSKPILSDSFINRINKYLSFK
ncbi:Pro-resilin [Papilio xuthus]|uniref:Pro-resilin n=1 Tax=Papilio xuthus TaxID=66420 RepID=A0A0N1PER6_PAPXU|nr:Pro-resilin [Papilio xuthus]